MDLLLYPIYNIKLLWKDFLSRVLLKAIFIFICIGVGYKGSAQVHPNNTVPTYLPPKVVVAGKPFVKPFNSPAVVKKLPSRKGIDGQLLIDGNHGGVSDFTHYNTEHGLSLSSVISSCVDRYGNLWFGTAGGGINRYDGKSFVVYTVKQGLGDNVVTNMLADKKGNIWLGNFQYGVTCYNGVKFSTYTAKEGLADNRVECLLEDSNGLIWIGTRKGGVSCWNGQSFTNYNTTNGLVNNNVKCIIEDKNKHIWLLSELGEVTVYDGKTFRVTDLLKPIFGKTIRRAFCDRDGNIWIGTERNGVCCYDGTSLKFYLADETTSENDVRIIFQDSRGNLWFGTNGNGISRYDGKSFQIFTSSQGLVDNRVVSIVEDKIGNLWFGTNGGGISRFNGISFTSYSMDQGIADNLIWSIHQDSKGNIWLGTENGVNRFDGKSFTTYTTAQGLADNVIVSILEDKKGQLWFGSFGKGVSRFDGKTFYTYTTQQGLADNIVRSMLADSKGNIWFGTYEGGVSCFDGKTFTTYTTEQGLSNNVIYNIIEDKKGNIWFGTYGGGVSYFDGKSFTSYTTRDGLAHNSVLSIMQDRQGIFWFGTAGGGVSLFDGKTFTNFSTKHGLCDNFVPQIIQDQDGRIFIGTNLGISVVAGWDKGFPVFENFNENNGYPLKDINTGQNTMWPDKKGIIWAATGDNVNALVRFDYAAVKRSTGQPKVVIQNLQLNEEKICWYHFIESTNNSDTITVAQQEAITYGNSLSNEARYKLKDQFSEIKFDSIAQDYPLPYNLILPSKNNHVTFEFTAIEPARPNLVRYQYYLEGYDKTWSPLTNKTNAVYGNIQGGKYTFWLKAKSPEGIWSEPVSYRFQVLPPWYQSFWAYLGYLIFTLIGVYFIIYLNAKRLKAANLNLERMVEERTYKIAKQKEELEAQTKEIQKQTEVLAEANATKDKFFSIIAHDLKNPFNSVVGHSDLLVQGLEYFKNNDIRRIASRINESAHQTYKLLENLLDWSMLQRGKIVSNPELCNLKFIAHEIVIQHLDSATTKKISIQNLINTDILAYCDGNMTRTILRNLISNAIKFTHANGMVTLDCREKDTYIEISVKDTGVGIPAHHIPSLFRIDRNYSTSGTQEEQGTGLGLLLCKELVEKQGGTIWVESEANKGTTISFTLPKD